MILLRRTLAVFAAGLVCLETCCALSGVKAPHGSFPLLAQQLESVGDTAPLAPGTETIIIPGPLPPFLRMAGISQEITRAEMMEMLARNISLWGYQNDKPTEYLLLIDRYVHLARELQSFAGSDSVIRVTGCEDASRLIKVLGYQFQQGCGAKGAALVTADAERAFLTTDSGFPITELEEALQKGTPFSYAFPGTPVPILFSEKQWTALSVWNKRGENGLLDVLMHDRHIDRLYSAMARIDPQTRNSLAQSPGLRRLAPFASELDFYGSWISIQSGQVKVPGGPPAEQTWKDLVGANLNSPGEFVTHLLARDRGWLVAYFDAVARIPSAQQAHLTDPTLMRRLYEAYRDSLRNLRSSSAESIYPRNVGLLLLLTRLQWQADNTPDIPGSLQAWKDILTRKSSSNNSHKLAVAALDLSSPQRFLELMAAASSDENGTGPLQIYLMLSAVDSGRSAQNKLSEASVRLLADKAYEFIAWYPTFSEFPALDDSSIASFIDAAEKIDKIPNVVLRTNALGAFQAEIGLWQILARQGQIPAQNMNRSWQSLVQPFSSATSAIQLFDASRSALQTTLQAASSDNRLTTQGQVFDLLAGPAQETADGRRAHAELARKIRAVMDDQRLVSLDTLFGLYEGLDDLAHGKGDANTMAMLATELKEFELPRPIFSGSEKAAWSPVVYTSRHAELQVRTDLTEIIRSKSTPAQFEAARGLLTPFLRDTLVGLNYAYYEPPGAQVLHNNPLFVRSHDFTAASVQGIEHIWGAPELVGVGVTAGGGAYLLGSLADLPYALASVEQDFISPTRVQALIWKEVVPEFLVDSIMPRWWGVDRNELHAAALYQKTGEELLTASASNSALREKVLGILADRMSPARLERTAQALQQPQSTAALIPHMLPADTFFLAEGFRTRYTGETASLGNAAKELDALIQKDPTHADPKRISKDFGVPHLEMAQSYTTSLFNMVTFPPSGAFDGRLFGESWDSTNLYWARLADEMGYSPPMLNVLVPGLTRRMVANVFATNVDDWPALLRALERTGEEFRQGRISVQGAGKTTAQNGTTLPAVASGNGAN